MEKRPAIFLISKEITFFFVAYFLLLGSSYSKNIIYLDNINEDFQIGNSRLQLLEDRNGNLSIDKILTSNQFRNASNLPLNENQFWYWFKFTLQDNSSIDKSWILQVPLHSQLIELYIQSSDGKVKKYSTGQLEKFKSRSIDMRTLAFNLPIEKKAPYTCFIKIYSSHKDFSFIISSTKKYLEVHTKAYLFLGIIYGILFLMAFYNFILFLSIKEKLYLYYVFYTLCSIFFLSWKDGLGFQFLWPEIPSLNSIHYNLGLFLLLVSFLLFANDFLELKQKHANLYKVTFGLIGINLIYFLITIFSDKKFDPLPYLYLLSYSYLLAVSISYFKQGFKSALYLVISLVSIILALGVIKLRYLGILEWNWFVDHIFNFALVFEAIIMSIASSDKIAFLRKEKENARERFLIGEKLKAENELINLKNASLEAELKFRNNELAVLATSLTQKVELFNHIKTDLLNAANEIPANAQIKKIIKKIEGESDFENHWTQFQLNFDKVHQNFLSNLSASYPMLKPADLLLCAYIKMGKSNKEIAPLLNISISGVEKKRLRVKEKLKLDNDNRLTDFIINFK